MFLIFLFIVYQNYCVPPRGGAITSIELEHFHALRGLARKNSLDLDAILDSADKGTLLPKGTKRLQNYYLAECFITPDRVIYALRSSKYHYQKNGFTLEQFAEQCGDDPDFHFAPATKGPRSMPKRVSQ